MKPRIIDYYKPTLNKVIRPEPFLRYYKREVGFWEFLNLNILNQIDYLCQKWLLSRGKLEQQSIVNSSISYQKVSINLDNIVQEIFEQGDLIQEIYNRQPRYLVMGRKHIQSLRLSDYFKFSFPTDYIAPLTGASGISGMFAGMQIICVPWMDGMIVLPDLND